MTKNINFKTIAHGSRDYEAAVVLRYDILRKPLGMSFTPEELEREKDNVHVAGFIDGALVATAMLVPQGNICKMQRVAVKEELRGSGIGTDMMRFCEDVARKHRFREIYCHARETAIEFYLKNRWRPEGDMFIENTIPHLKMRKTLTA